MPNISNTNELIVKINPTKASNADSKSIFGKVDTIKLLKKNGEPIKHILKLVAKDQYFFTLEALPYSDKHVVVFDQQGREIFTTSNNDDLGHKVSVQDFCVKNATTFFILDGMEKKIFEINLKGNVIQEHKIPFSARNIAYNPVSKYLFFYKNEMALNQEDTTYFYNIIVLNDNLDVLAKYDPFYIPEYSKRFVYTTVEPFSSFNNSTYLNLPFNDTIYEVSQADWNIKEIFDFGEYKIPKEYLQKGNIQELTRQKMPYVINVFNYRKCNDLTMFYLLFREELLMVSDKSGVQKIFRDIRNSNGKLFIPPIAVDETCRAVSVVNEHSLSMVYEFVKGDLFYDKIIEEGSTYLLVYKIIS